MKKLLESWKRFINEAPKTPYEHAFEDGYEGEEPRYKDDPQYMDGYNDGKEAREDEARQ